MNTELQQRIIKQATRMFLCNGIKSVTMDMIASQLGISKRTLYENFKEKNELLLACLESQEMERRARLEVYFANRKNVIDLLLNVYEDILRFMRNTSPMFFVDMTLLTFQFELLKKSDQIFNSKYTFTEIFETIFKSFIRGIATPEGVKYTDEFFEENR